MLRSLVYPCIAFSCLGFVVWVAVRSEPQLSPSERRMREVYPQLLGACQAFDDLALDDGEEWDDETIYQVWRLAVKACAAARGEGPRETRVKLLATDDAKAAIEQIKPMRAVDEAANANER